MTGDMDTVIFSKLNYTVLALYLLVMLGIGLLFARRQKTTEDYFLAGRGMNWLVVGMSMFATLTSAVTYMGLPGYAYKENISLIAVAFISPIVAPVIIFVFYPFYSRLRVTTSYEYIDRRFGRQARFAVSGLFILARLGWLGTVVYAPALALSVVTGLPLWTAILIMGLLATAYTVLGGITADIWTDVVQFLIMLVGAIWLLASLHQAVPDGYSGILRMAAEHHHLPTFRPSWTELSATVAAIVFFFQLMQDYGTDQTTVQRLMTIPTFRGMAKATFFNACSDLFFISTLLFIGLGLFAYHLSFPERLPDGIAGDKLLPYYIIHSLPDGISGLLITAIFAAAMSSVDSGISSLATVIINDFVKPLRKTPADDRKDLALARGLTLAFGLFATGIAFYVSRFETIIEGYTSIISLFNAPILCLFLAGIFTRTVSFKAWIAGAGFGMTANWLVQQYAGIHWIYFFPTSLFTTLAFTLLISRLARTPPCPIEWTIWGRKGRFEM